MEIRQGKKKMYRSRKYVIPRQKATIQWDCLGVDHSENQRISQSFWRRQRKSATLPNSFLQF